MHLCPLDELMVIYLASLPLTWTSWLATKKTLGCYDKLFINTKVIILYKWSILEQNTRITFTYNECSDLGQHNKNKVTGCI